MQLETLSEQMKPLAKLKQTKNRHELVHEQTLASVVSVESELLKGARQYLDAFGFTEVVVPHITKATGACENIDTMFDLNYFGERAYLVQTGQLYLESLIPRLGNVFCIGSSFRAEPDVDSRHLTEFTLVELELPCNFKELLVHIENLIHTMMQRVINHKRQDLDTLGVNVQKLKKIKPPYKRVTYTDAIDLLNDLGISVKWGDDLKSRHEKTIVDYFGKPTFITHFPEAIKFFNMRQNEKNPRIVNSSDLILPNSGEAVGAAEREYEHDPLYKRLASSKMLKMLMKRGGSIEDFRWYLEHVKQGSVPHAGCGIGLNRVTQFVLGIDDIRTTTAFPMNKISLM